MLGKLITSMVISFARSKSLSLVSGGSSMDDTKGAARIHMAIARKLDMVPDVMACVTHSRSMDG
jgi:hypothetical protein